MTKLIILLILSESRPKQSKGVFLCYGSIILLLLLVACTAIGVGVGLGIKFGTSSTTFPSRMTSSNLMGHLQVSELGYLFSILGPSSIILNLYRSYKLSPIRIQSNLGKFKNNTEDNNYNIVNLYSYTYTLSLYIVELFSLDTMPLLVKSLLQLFINCSSQ